jgi:hypothetical protein
MEIGSIFPVLTLILGWALNEVGSSLRLRREDRRAAGPLLADLLMLRHQLFALENVVAHLRSHVQFPAQVELWLKQYICQAGPEPSKFAEKFEEAVTQIARADPILAFRLRGQPFLGQVLPQWRAIIMADETASKIWQGTVEPGFLKLVKPHLEQLILDVAWVHGWWAWFRTRRRLKRPLEFAQAEKDGISAYLAALQAACPSAPEIPGGDAAKPPQANAKSTS